MVKNNKKKCGNYILRSLNHGMYLQRFKKSTLHLFGDKRCYINETEVYHGIFIIKCL